jgi:TetR/AcrR family transcriptional repressor of lmrAB and yxaGH operons
MSTVHPRERMIQSALLLMGSNGVEATSFSQVIEHSGAPRGSIYHHFPGGKAQLVEEATRYAGEATVALFRQMLKTDDPVAGVHAAADFWRKALHDTDFSAGCPVLAAALEGDSLPGAREAARESFQRFQDLHFQLLTRAGVASDRARSLAAIAVSAIEGAIILSRAQKSNLPLDRVLDELDTLFRDALRQVHPPTESR